jgi:hypothetical protein
MPVNDREPDEKDCSFRLIVILFPYRETVFVINLRRGNYQAIFVKPNSIESYYLFKNTYTPGRHNEILPSKSLSVNRLICCTVRL